MMQEDMNIEQRVLLLGLYKKQADETFNDIILMLEDSGVFSKKDGKKHLKILKKNGFLTDDSLSMVGITFAKEVEQEFKL